MPKNDDPLEKALHKLRGENAYTRLDGVRKLGKIGTRDVVPYLIEALQDENGDVRYDAAVMLGRIGDPRAVPALADRLLDGDIYSLIYAPVYVSDAAWGALEAIGTPEALTAIKTWGDKLLERLSMNDPDIRWHAAVFLGRLHDERAIPKLKDMIYEDDEWMPVCAAEALENIGTQASIEALIEAASVRIGEIDKNFTDCRCHLAEVLGRHKVKEVVPELIDMLNEPDEMVQRCVSEALETIGSRDALAAVEAWRRTQRGHQNG